MVANGAGFSRAVLLCVVRMIAAKEIAAKRTHETNY